MTTSYGTGHIISVFKPISSDSLYHYLSLWKSLFSGQVSSISKIHSVYLLVFSFFSYFLIPSFSQFMESHTGTPSTGTTICYAFIIVSLILCHPPCPAISY